MKLVLTTLVSGLVLLTGSLGLPAALLPSTPESAAIHGLVLPTAGEPAWASAGTARVHPGIQTFTEGAQCTANFVWHAPDGQGGFDLYVGQAAHCAGTGASTETNGCEAGTLPLGTPVDVGTGHDGVLAYSSWVAMQEAGETDPATCAYNDFALVRVAEADEAAVSPAVPFFGGPLGLAPSESLSAGDEVYSFGNSGLRLGVEPVLSWKHGAVVASDAWGTKVYTATPGVPGDSGSGFLTSDGQAFGVLSTVEVLPLAASNNAASLASALDYASAHGGPQVTLGTAPFAGGLA